MKFISVEKEGGKKNSENEKAVNYNVSVKKKGKSVEEWSLDYIKAALFFLLVGVIGIVVEEFVSGYRAAGEASLVWGTLPLLFFGIGYLIFPDVRHKEVWKPSIVSAQFWFVLVGLLIVVGFNVASIHMGALEGYYDQARQIGVYLVGLSGLMFVVNMWKSM